MKRVVSLLGSFLLGATAITLGWGINLSQADQLTNNGNHFGQSGINQNGNNGSHYGWVKNENGAYNQTTTYTSNTNSNSVPGPDTLILLGAGLSGLAMWRRMSREA